MIYQKFGNIHLRFGRKNKPINNYDELISNCEEIAKNPDLGTNYKGITKQLLGMKSNRHIIFYRTLDKDYVEITRALHERIDLKKKNNWIKTA